MVLWYGNWLQLFVIQITFLPIFIKNDIIDNFKTNEMHYAELILISSLDGYIKHLDNQISNLKSNLEFYQNEHKYAEKDIITYLSNPINAYLLTKRLTTDWKHVENIMRYDSGIEYVQNITTESIKGYFPNDNDLKRTIINLAVLQKEYHLTVEDIASGNLDGIQFGKSFSAVDCFEIGRILILESNFSLAKKWLEESLKRYDDKSNNMIRQENILDFLAWSNLQLGYLEVALEQSKEAFVLNPSLEHIYKNIKYIESRINDKNENENENNKLSYEKWSIAITNTYNTMNNIKYDYMDIFEKGCNGNLNRTSEHDKYLICTYLTDNHPFLKLAPFKIEEIHYDPIIIIAYDIISNDEIEILKNLTNNQLNFNDDHIQITQKYTIPVDTNNSVLSNLDQRIGDVSFLDMNSGEKLQISKYNHGTISKPHFDLLVPIQDSTGQFIGFNKGNRIATALIYLNDVESGGETVFPFLETVISPKKGNAVFWYNLHSTGKQDLRMLNGDCPVKGEAKWVANKWIREKYQDSRRPCEIIADDVY